MFNCTIVIINWNSWDYLFPCIEAVKQQILQDYKIIVVDNVSFDQAPGSLLDEYPRLTFIQNVDNIGFAAANNQAIRLADDCEWIVLLNPDTLPEKNWLERLCKAFTVYPDFSFFGSRLVMAGDPDKLDGTGDVYHMGGLSWRAGHGLDISSITDDEPIEVFALSVRQRQCIGGKMCCQLVVLTKIFFVITRMWILASACDWQGTDPCQFLTL